jgi:hypothetical protein
MRKVRRVLGPAVLLLVLLAALDGPLFPWSPVKPGYSHLALSRADIYYPAGVLLDPAYRMVDGYISEAEEFHRLKMPDRITVIEAKNWTDFHLQMPAIRGNAVGAVTLQTGTVVWITPKIAEKHFDVGEFLRHELSHAIIDQNATTWHSFRMMRQPWFYEGIAVSFGRQKSYLSRDEFVARAQVEPLAPVFEGGSSDMRFNYPAWRYFIEYLSRTRGREAFQKFLLSFMQQPDHAMPLFRESFGIAFTDAVREFEKQVREGKTP